MKLILYRHAQPLVSTEEKVTGDAFPEWLTRYEESGIEPFEWTKKRYEKVYTSPTPRAKQTALVLSNEVIEKKALSEAEVPIRKYGFQRKRAARWLEYSRMRWLCWDSLDCESKKQFSTRVHGLMNWLNNFPSDEQIVIVSHGWLIHTLTKKLRRRGWKIVSSSGHGFLSQTILEKRPATN